MNFFRAGRDVEGSKHVTDVLERHAAVDDVEERAFVTLTVANQLRGIPVLGVREFWVSNITPHPTRAPRNCREPIIVAAS